MRVAALVTGLGAVALVLPGCSTSSPTEENTTVTKTVTSSAAAGTSASPGTSGPSTPASGDGLPQPPAGAAQISTSEHNGVMHARYSVDGQTPQQVVDYYVGIWTGDGFTINGRSGGGDPGKYGGSGARANGSKSGTFVAVDAGAGNGRPTYFDVCHGANEDRVRHCGKGQHGN